MVGGPSGPRGEEHLASLQKLVDELGLADRVRFEEPQPHELLSTYYRAADVCVVPSRSESFGLVALEAAACGTPVVAAAVGGLTTLVEDGRTGLVVDPSTPEAFAAAASGVLADPLLAERLATAAVVRSRRYTWAQAASLLRGDLRGAHRRATRRVPLTPRAPGPGRVPLADIASPEERAACDAVIERWAAARLAEGGAVVAVDRQPEPVGGICGCGATRRTSSRCGSPSASAPCTTRRRSCRHPR